MKFLSWFLSLSRAKQIAFSVVAIHFVLLFALSIHHLISFSPKRPIIVRTKVLTSAPQKFAAASPSKSTPSPAPSKKTAAAPSKATTTVAPKPKKAPAKPAPNKAPAKSQTSSPKQEQLFKEIAESFDQLTKTDPLPVPQKQLSLPSLILPKAEVVDTSTHDPTYGEFLIGYLQAALDLPEFGEVKATLEIDREGRLLSCAILDSRSRKNSEFLKNRLPELVYPCFNDFHIDETSLNFTITFRNVETD